jgi:hypothetical protein
MLMERSIIIDRLDPDTINIPSNNSSAGNKKQSTAGGKRSIFPHTKTTPSAKPSSSWKPIQSAPNDNTISTSTTTPSMIQDLEDKWTSRFNTLEQQVAKFLNKMNIMDTNM